MKSILSPIGLALSLTLLGFSSARAQQCVELPTGTATINGTVTSQQSSAAVFATVTATAEIDGFGPASFTGFAALGGAFSIQVAAPATYVVTASPVDFVHAPELYDGVLTLAAATEISVTPNQIVNDVDFTVLTGASISGTVTAEGSGDPVPDVTVQVSGLGDVFAFGFGATDENGEYTVAGLATGPHQVLFFSDPEETDFLTEYYNDNPSAPGDAVNVTAPGVSDIDAALAIGGHITGTVTGSGGPLEDVGVGVIATSGFPFAGGVTDVAGNYSLLAPAGAHKVVFSHEGFITEFYDDKATAAAADNVNVTSGGVTADIDADLAPSGAITGVVTDATSGDPIEGAVVAAYDSTNATVSFDVTSAAGVYTLNSNLKTGTYKVGFTSGASLTGGNGYVPRFYLDKGGLAGATAVSVTAPNTTPNIDQELVPCDDASPSTTTTSTLDGGTTTTTLDGATECGDPALVIGGSASGTPHAVTATDGLFILRVGVGLEDCLACVCDVNGSGGVSATDALTVLNFAVGIPVSLNCPAC